MHLFNLGEFGKRFGIDLSVSDFKDAVTEASKAATQSLASQLRYGDFTAFDFRRDVFRVDRMFGSADSAATYRTLRLSRGFVNEDSAFSVLSSTTPINIRYGDASSYEDLQNAFLDGRSSKVFLDPDKGLVHLYDLSLAGMWVVVEYSGGLAVNNNQQFSSVPEWMQECAQLWAALHLTRNRALQSENDDPDTLKAALRNMYSTNTRVNPSALLPFATLDRQPW